MIPLGVLAARRPVAGGFSPADFTNLAGWWDASDTLTTTQWDDLSGNGRHFTGACGIGSINTLTAASFNGSQWMDSSTAAVWKLLHDGTPYIIALAAYITGTTRGTLLATNRGLVNPGMHWYTNLNTASGISRYRVDNSAATIAYIDTASGFTTSSTATALTALIDPGAATAANRVKLAKNTDAPVGSNSNTGTPDSGDYAALRVGATTSGGASFTGSIGEIAIVTGADATETNRATLAAYLVDKWGI